jgi:hypothetical protein
VLFAVGGDRLARAELADQPLELVWISSAVRRLDAYPDAPQFRGYEARRERIHRFGTRSVVRPL